MRLRRLLAVALLVVSGCGPALDGVPRSPAPAVGAGDDAPHLDPQALARDIHRRTNAERQRRGLPPLRWRADLLPIAQGHSLDMARRGFFDHRSPEGETPNDRATRAGVACEAELTPSRTRVGVLENLFKTGRWTEWTERTVGGQTTRTYAWQAPEAIVRAVVQGWLDSPGHRRNLLDPTARGEAVALAFATDDAIYVTQILC